MRNTSRTERDSGCNSPKFYISGGTAETSSIAVGAGTPCCDFVDEAGRYFVLKVMGKEMGIYKGRMLGFYDYILVMSALNSLLKIFCFDRFFLIMNVFEPSRLALRRIGILDQRLATSTSTKP